MPYQTRSISSKEGFTLNQSGSCDFMEISAALGLSSPWQKCAPIFRRALPMHLQWTQHCLAQLCMQATMIPLHGRCKACTLMT